MKKLIRNILILFVPTFFISFLIFSYNVLKLEFQFAHQSAHVYQFPFSWQKYLVISEIQDFYKKVTENVNKTNLPKVKVYISEQSSRKLLSNLPDSTKNWVRAFITTTDTETQEINLRYRGDNPDNWLKSKKHFRIKTKKRELIDGYRYMDFFPLDANSFIPFLISEKMNLINQKVKLVEVYFNGISKGLYFYAPKLDELFLRKNKQMPVNLYKGENWAAETRMGLNRNLFNNPGLWSKEAIFNQETGNEDMKKFLGTLMSNQSNLNPTINDYIDLDYFSKFDAYLTLTTNIHSDSFHNMRLIIDPWKGKVTQLITDPVLDDFESNKQLNLDFSTNDLNSFLNKNIEFIHKKYQWLYFYSTKEDLTKFLTEYYSRIKNDLKKADKKEFYFLKFIDQDRDDTSYINQFDVAKIKLENNKKKILRTLESETRGSWNKTFNGLNIVVNDFTPLSNINVSFKGSQPPKWIGLDENYNNIIDKNEPIFFNESLSSNITLPIVLYANRLKKSSKDAFIDSDYRIDIGKTSFTFITENNKKPDGVESENFFSKKKFTLIEKSNENSVKKNQFNKIIYLNKPNDFLEKKFSGTIFVSDDLIVNEEVIIEPGTIFSIMPGKNIIFKKKILAKGSKDKPIIFQKNFDNQNNSLGIKPWGTLALLGKDTKGSILNYVKISGGSGGYYNQFKFTSMFSVHNTSNIIINNSDFSFNEIFDDNIHIIYSDNVQIKNSTIKNAFRDAIDIDVSKNIILENLEISNAKNDGIDLMESDAKIILSKINNSEDKGISIGENSKAFIKETKISENVIGVAIKDGSLAKINDSEFIDNQFQIAAYAKNWQYGGGGNVDVYNSSFKAKINSFSTTVDPEDLGKDLDNTLLQNSKINIFNSQIKGQRKILGKNLIIN